MERKSWFPNADWAAVLTLLATGLVVAWPVIRGGYLTYVDNPSHIAEVHSLAFDAHSGWSDISYCGFPLGHLHSPLWYGGLAWLVKLGLPLGPLYALMLYVGFLFPGLAVYSVARRHLSPLLSGLLAYVLVVQRPAIVGLGSALGGMWTFFISTGLFVLLVDRLGRRGRSRRDLFWIAALIGLTGLTHLFTVVPLVVLAAVHLLWTLLRRRSEWGWLLYQAGAAALGIVATCAYWVPQFLAREHTIIDPQNFSTPLALARLFLPASVLDLVYRRITPMTVDLIVEAIPMFVLLVAGVAGVLFLRARKDETPLYGAIVGGTMFVLVVLVAPVNDTTLLGPVSWRMLYFVRVGMALAAVALLVRFAPAIDARMGRLAIAGVAAAGILLGALWGAPLRGETTPAQGQEMTEVRELWRWLRENRSGDWGRVYVQDTFMTPPLERSLSRSHVLSLTAMKAGVRQLGAAYTIVPYRTARWTLAEFGLIYRQPVNTEERRSRLVRLMKLTNATHIVTADPTAAEQLLSTPLFELLHRAGRFAVIHLTGTESEWVVAKTGEGDGSIDVAVEEYRTGLLRFRVSGGGTVDELLVKVAYHPFWRIRGAESATLYRDYNGMMVIQNLKTEQPVELEFRSPSWPKWISIGGWICILVLGWYSRRDS